MSNVQRTCDPKRTSEVPGWPHEPVPTCSLGEMERGKDVGIVYIYIWSYIKVVVWNMLGGGLKYCMFYFHPYLGKWSNLTSMFSDVLKPPTRYSVMGGNDGESARELWGKHVHDFGWTLTLNVYCLFGSFIHTKDQVGELLLKYLLRRLVIIYTTDFVSGPWCFISTGWVKSHFQHLKS